MDGSSSPGREVEQLSGWKNTALTLVRFLVFLPTLCELVTNMVSG